MTRVYSLIFITLISISCNTASKPEKSEIEKQLEKTGLLNGGTSMPCRYLKQVKN